MLCGVPLVRADTCGVADAARSGLDPERRGPTGGLRAHRRSAASRERIVEHKDARPNSRNP
jgi:hypothetical protein